ncbi:MAG: tRNA (N6-isopentenyl adenosine(37)-C2)-methylthiotransferase MiaB [Chitinispirillaceae bacterium]|nr:tRNA (N6-isopentenyl adenosine(37)-C2)-methylthiotransferase MiaB [Chitinispirillaceae bacterium]
MNVADSDALRRALAARGYTSVEKPGEADLIVVNTCSVREHAEQRALARIAEFAAVKKKRPGARLWVVGCMAERMGADVKKKIKGVDAAVGAPELADAPAAVRRYLDKKESAPAAPPQRGVSEFVSVMRGCNNFCAYCIVPFVRGRESSVPAEAVERDIRERVAGGVREVTLLGQNVNSYHDGGLDFPDLLRRVAAIDGLLRVRFTTSHPKDLSEKLVRTIAGTPKLCRHLHLPAQSGSDRILSLMNRRYTSAHYRSLVAMIRKALPDADITTDLLVGFPSETEEDFNETLGLVEEIRFTSAFMFAYSPRPGTAAERLSDDVPRETKISRLNRLIQLQTAITRCAYEKTVGKKLEVLVSGRLSGGGEVFNKGHDIGCKRVLVPCANLKAGTILTVRAVRSSGMTLIAERT